LAQYQLIFYPKASHKKGSIYILGGDEVVTPSWHTLRPYLLVFEE